MSAIELVLQQPWVTRAGWTLVHFLWQGTVIAVLLAAARGIAGRNLTPRARYAMACLALGLMAIAPLATFLAAGGPGVGALPVPIWRASGGVAWERTLAWLVVVWLCGAAVFSVRLIGGWRLTRRLRTVAVRPAPHEWRQALDDLIRRMRVSAPVRLLISSRVAVPVVVGWLRPVILMPAAALTGLPIEQVQALLAHELAHIFRHDYLVNILQNVVEALLFYHPAVWWVSGQIRAERELCCDDLAVAACGDVLAYAYALAELDSGRRAGLRAAVAADGGSLLQRIRRLLGESQPLSHGLPGSGTAWALSLLWLAGIGAAALPGSSVSPAHSIPVTPRLFVAPADAAPPAGLPEPPPPARLSPALAALLFDPLFANPQTPVQDASPATAQEKKKIHVEGTVISQAGEPLNRATVRLEMIDGPQGQSSYSSTTDDAGKFTIEGPRPGSYTLYATKTGFLLGSYGARMPASSGAPIVLSEGAEIRNLEIKLVPQGIIRGRVTDQDGEPVRHGRVRLLNVVYSRGRTFLATRVLTTTNSLGNFVITPIPPGRYYLSAEVTEQSPDVEPGMGDVTTYYPNALDAGGAATIGMAGGSRLEDFNLRLRRERVYSVTGKVMWNGALVKDPIIVFVTLPGRHPFSSLQTKDGSFRMRDQLPGQYVLQAATSGPVGRGTGTLSGKLEFTIKDSNLDGLVLALEQGVAVSGVLKLNGSDWQSQFNQPAGTTGAPAPVSRPTVRLTAEESADRLDADANDDGSFKFQPAGAGRYLLNVMGLPKGAYVKSARYGTLDVTRAPLQIGGAGAPLEIDVSLKGATVTGALSGDKGEPLRGISVTAWPKIPNLGDSALGVRGVMTDQKGTFTISGLAPGEYYVAAWEEIDFGLLWELSFLGRFTGEATGVKLDEGSQTSVTVKLITRDAIAAEVAKLP